MIGGAGPRTRAGRLSLVARLDLVRYASGLLRSKEEALERERVRLEGHAARARDEWVRRCAEATAELVRARMLGASGELSLLVAAAVSTASFEPDWQTSMGIAYPGSVECQPGEQPAVVSTAALLPAIDAYRRALRAAADHAAADAAMHRLEAELAGTRRRRRAIEDRLQPDLERLVHELDLHLDELDREEALRVRTATERREARRT